mmetsp:Transcript_34132/g.77115  ORF Transcript_34132/g.77115 Transcript_34132/m.77115 type:complete len:361 (-) Transcript_34132:502-1584(-)
MTLGRMRCSDSRCGRWAPKGTADCPCDLEGCPCEETACDAYALDTASAALAAWVDSTRPGRRTAGCPSPPQLPSALDPPDPPVGAPWREAEFFWRIRATAARPPPWTRSRRATVRRVSPRVSQPCGRLARTELRKRVQSSPCPSPSCCPAGFGLSPSSPGPERPCPKPPCPGPSSRLRRVGSRRYWCWGTDRSLVPVAVAQASAALGPAVPSWAQATLPVRPSSAKKEKCSTYALASSLSGRPCSPPPPPVEASALRRMRPETTTIPPVPFSPFSASYGLRAVRVAATSRSSRDTAPSSPVGCHTGVSQTTRRLWSRRMTVQSSRTTATYCLRAATPCPPWPPWPSPEPSPGSASEYGSR